MCVARRGLLAVEPAPVLARSELLLLLRSSPLARSMAPTSALVLARRPPSAAVPVVSQLCERLLLLLRRRRPRGLWLGRIPLVLRRRLSLALDSAPSSSSLSPLLPTGMRVDLSQLDSERVTDFDL